MNKSEHKFRPEIEGLRALAVISVTLFHFDVPIFKGGFLGVDIFFVISGYLITGKILADMKAGTFTFRNFYTSRIRRILPAATVTIILTLIVGAVIFPPHLFEQLGESAIWTLLFSANVFFSSATGYFDPAALEQPLLHFWSLAVEEQFYFVWPAALFLLFSWSRSRITLAILLLFFIFLAVSEAWIEFDTDGSYYQSPPRFFEFFAGALIVGLERRVRSLPVNIQSGIFIFGLVAMFACLMFFSASLRFPGIGALPIVLATAIVIASGGAGSVNYVLTNGTSRFIGRISYSLYLVHWPLVVYYKFVTGEHLSVFSQIVLLVFSIALAWMLWLFVETSFRLRGPAGMKRPYLALAGLLVAALIPAVASAELRGLPIRISPNGAERYAKFEDLSEEGVCRKAGTPKMMNCVIGALNENSASVILLGDSHSTPFRAPLDPMLKSLNLKGFSRNTDGCPPIYGASVMHERSQTWFLKCKASFDRIWKYVTAADSVDTIVLAARWSFYVRTTRLGESESKGRIFLGTSPDDEKSVARSEAVFKYRMLATVKGLLASGKRVILIGQVPELGFDLKRCAFSPIGRHLSDCALRTRSQAEGDMAYANDVLRGIAGRYPKSVAFFNPLDLFCDETNCSYMLDQKYAYKDNSHINYFAARKVSAFFGSRFRDRVSGVAP